MDDLTQIQEKLDEVNKRTLHEMRKVKQKYEKKVWEEEAEKKCGDTLNCLGKRKNIIELIPNFWSTAFLGLPSLRKLLTEEDKKIMGYLKTVDVSDCLHVKSGFTITFEFEQNAFFENVKLSREYSFSHKGIIDTSGTEIKWKDKGITTGPEADVIEKGSEQSSTDVRKSIAQASKGQGSLPSLSSKGSKKILVLYSFCDCSFLAWFSDHLAKDQDRDEVAEKIAYSLWPNAPEYFKNATPTSVSMASVEHVDENGLPISDNTTKCHHRKGALVNTKLKELMEVHAEFVKAKEAALKNRWDLEQKYDLEVEVEEKVLRKQKREVCRSIYDRRSETIKDIPYFWLNAFISHGALADILSEEDRKIFRYLESVNVEETENPTLVYTITLNFNKGNPYFENASLRNTFSVEGVGTKGCTIKWKDNFGNGHGNPGDGNASFFTWFCSCGYVSEGNLDEVAEVIIEDLWPNAINYYFNVSFFALALRLDCLTMGSYIPALINYTPSVPHT
ncbi:uncharacterized protein LOC113358594 isoform X1 [Papaver somniferum]|uniref:uncharacterized protein LOC113358594 isoform X1 n=2 Tax=Papaver somniferum TaxID=3469 RepID=UPI000E6FB5EB|nr:uncharacterized protein LOC113358594 isoform X1 [Papaver somniferum]